MASQGPYSPGTAANNSSVGITSWSDVDNIKTENSIPSVSSGKNQQTNYIKATGFGFSIPSGATIDGIIVEVRRSRSAQYQTKDSVASIVVNGSISSSNKADTVTNWPTTYTYKTYGSSSDVWGEALTSTIINASDFGFVLSCYNYRWGKNNSTFANIDHIRITVYYTEGGSSSAIKTVNGLAKASVKTVDNLAIASVKTINELA